MRILIFKLHKWTGWLVSIFLLLMCVTGLLLLCKSCFQFFLDEPAQKAVLHSIRIFHFALGHLVSHHRIILGPVCLLSMICIVTGFFLKPSTKCLQTFSLKQTYSEWHERLGILAGTWLFCLCATVLIMYSRSFLRHSFAVGEKIFSIDVSQWLNFVKIGSRLHLHSHDTILLQIFWAIFLIFSIGLIVSGMMIPFHRHGKKFPQKNFQSFQRKNFLLLIVICSIAGIFLPTFGFNHLGEISFAIIFLCVFFLKQHT